MAGSPPISNPHGNARAAYVMGRLLCLLGGALLITRAAAEAETKKPELLTVTFQPGKLGLGAEWATGLVTRVDKGGQGQDEGVVVGDRFMKIDGRTYTEKLIDKRIAGEAPFEVTLYRRPPADPNAPAAAPKQAPRKHDPDDPPKPDFRYATELDAKSFQQMVYKVTNGTDNQAPPPYYPIVMFHMSWCKHCRHALPEFENAAAMVDLQRNKSGGGSKQTFPKFFVLECDGAAGNKDVCDMYGHASWPLTLVFRDRRSYRFNRPRMAQTYAWWVLQVTRPPVVGIESTQDIEMFEKRGGFFALHADESKDYELITAWAEVALDNIEEQNFGVVRPGSVAARTFPPAPSVGARGAGLEPLALEGAMTRESLSTWVSFNQFTPVTDLSPYNEGSLAKCGFPVIVFLYDAKVLKQVQAMEKFTVKAKELRKSGQYLFAAVDVTTEDNRNYLQYSFPLLFELTATGRIAQTPRIFAFQGRDVYWESPLTPDPAVLSTQSIAAFLADSWARQDTSYQSMAKDKGKVVMRLATGSLAGLLITVVGAFVLLACCCGCASCAEGICTSDDDTEGGDTPTKKND